MTNVSSIFVKCVCVKFLCCCARVLQCRPRWRPNCNPPIEFMVLYIMFSIDAILSILMISFLWVYEGIL